MLELLWSCSVWPSGRDLATASMANDALITYPFELAVPQTLALRGSDNQWLWFLTALGRKRFDLGVDLHRQPGLHRHRCRRAADWSFVPSRSRRDAIHPATMFTFQLLKRIPIAQRNLTYLHKRWLLKRS